MSRLLCASSVLGALTFAVSFAGFAGSASIAWAQAAGGGVSFGASATPTASAAATAPPPASAPAGSAPPAASGATPGTPPAGSSEPTTPPPADSNAPDVADEAADTQANAEWAERDRLVMESNTLTGGTGLLRTQHAETGAPGQLRISFTGEGFGGASFLCSKNYPCVDPNGSSTPVTSDSMGHVGGTLSAGASLVKLGPGVLDGYAAVTAYANSDASNRPGLLQVLGDMDLGVKYVFPVGNIVRFGVFSELWLVNGTGSVGLSGNSTSAKFGGIVTADLRGIEGTKVPLRFSLNGVYYVDNTAQVVSDLENTPVSKGGLGTQISRIERYGLGISRVDEFDVLPGIEGLFADDRVRPFVEAKVEVPNNRQGYRCNPNNPSHDSCMKNDQFALSTLTIGSRFFPWKRGFSVLAAIDIGLSGTDNFIEEMQPIPPWMLFIGAGWAIDTEDRPPVYRTNTVTKVVEKAPPPRGHVVGFVHEKGKTEPIQGAIVTYRDHSELAPLATGADGKFGDDVPAGVYTYDIKADGYRPGSCEVTVSKTGAAAATTPAPAPPAGTPPTAPATPAPATPAPSAGGANSVLVTIDCPLDALPKVGSLTGHVRDADSNQPLSGVPVIFTDSAHKELRITTDASGGFRFDGVTPGTGQVNVTSDGYLVLITPADIKIRQETQIDLALRPQPRNSAVSVTKNEITIKEQIQFALDSSVILPASFGLLTEIADTMIRHTELLRIEVQGHTDNSGTPEHNKLLSEQRAEAVRSWLLQHGVLADKLVARGYGQSKPLVPNVTAGNRAKNRRVQFIITEKEGSGASAAPAPPSPGAPAPPAAPRKPAQPAGF